MVVLVNGCFGVGKTTVANELVSRIPNSLLFDPEEIGGMLRSILSPIDHPDDFQHYPLWRTLFVDLASRIHQEYGRNLIIPMTIWRAEYFEEVRSGLENHQLEVSHFCLVAERETILGRIRNRGHQAEGDWVYEQLDSCLAALDDPRFEPKISAEGRTATEVAVEITQRLSGALGSL